MTSTGVTTLTKPGGPHCQQGRWLLTGRGGGRGDPCPNKAHAGSVYCTEHLADAMARIRAHWARAVKG